MKIALVMAILTIAVAASQEEKFNYFKCTENCSKGYDTSQIHYICYKENNRKESQPTRCYFDCEQKDKESFGKTLEEIECDWYEGCHNNCTEEEKQLDPSDPYKWCTREGSKEIKGRSICFVKCQGRHNWHFEKEPVVVLC